MSAMATANGDRPPTTTNHVQPPSVKVGADSNMTTDSSDDPVAVKYRKLAEQYAKLKSHNQVLKRAVLESKQECVNLKSGLKERDQSIRKMTQEQESLQFVNGQLSTRISVLQESLDSAAAGSRHPTDRRGRKVTPRSSSAALKADNGEDLEVLQGELMSKIRENEQLHSEIDKITSDHRSIINELHEKLRHYQSQSVLNFTDKATLDLETRNAISSLNNENAALKAQVKDLQSIVEESENRVLVLESKLRSPVHVKVNDSLDHHHPGPPPPPLSAANDMGDDSCSLLSVPSMSNLTGVSGGGGGGSELDSVSGLDGPITADTIKKQPQQQPVSAEEMRARAGIAVDQLISGLCTWHTYSAQRIPLIFDSAGRRRLSSSHSQLCTSHKKLSSSLKDSMKLFRAFCQALPVAGGGRETHPRTSFLSMPTFRAFLKSVLSYLGEMKATMQLVESTHQSENELPWLTEPLINRNTEMSGVLHSLSFTFCTLEQTLVQLDVENGCSGREQISGKSVFTQLTHCLNDLRAIFKNLAKAFNHKITLEHQLAGVSEKVKTANECLYSSIHALARYTRKVSEVLAECEHSFILAVDSECQRKHSNTEQSTAYLSSTLVSDSSVESLQLRIESLTVELERKDKECSELASQIMHLRSTPPSQPTYLTSVPGSQPDTPFPGNTPPEALDGLAVFYRDEAEALYNRLCSSEEEKASLQDRIETLQGELESVGQELESTRESYQLQLSAMSDHLCEVNDRSRLYHEDGRLPSHGEAGSSHSSNLRGALGKLFKP